MYSIIKISLFSLPKCMWNEISCISFLQTIFDRTINMKLMLGFFIFCEKYTELFSLEKRIFYVSIFCHSPKTSNFTLKDYIWYT